VLSVIFGDMYEPIFPLPNPPPEGEGIIGISIVLLFLFIVKISLFQGLSHIIFIISSAFIKFSFSLGGKVPKGG